MTEQLNIYGISPSLSLKFDYIEKSPWRSFNSIEKPNPPQKLSRSKVLINATDKLLA